MKFPCHFSGKNYFSLREKNTELKINHLGLNNGEMIKRDSEADSHVKVLGLCLESSLTMMGKYMLTIWGLLRLGVDHGTETLLRVSSFSLLFLAHKKIHRIQII